MNDIFERQYEIAQRNTLNAWRNVPYTHRFKVRVDGVYIGDVALFNADNTWRTSSEREAPRFRRLRSAIEYLSNLGDE